MDDVLVPLGVCGILFVGLPWIILHYLTQWKRAGSLTADDEKLMDGLYETARRLDDRLATIERIIAADHPEYRPPYRDTPPAERDQIPRTGH